jgi:uncharacterized membrane protein
MRAASVLQQKTSFTRLLHRVLELGMLIKGFDAVMEMLGGILFWFASNVTFDQWVISLTQHELIEDPQDIVALFLRQAAAQLSFDAHLFGSTYLIVHGFAKLWLVTGLLRGKRWAYPATLGFLSLFIIYQIYRLSYSFMPGLLLLTIFDFIFAVLIYREYLLSKNT